MILDSLQNAARPATRPRVRIREEAAGGSLVETETGMVSRLSEDELAAWRGRAASDDGVVYYAVRSWTTEKLAAGCSSSPDRIYLEVTQRCNLSCAYCYRDAGKAANREMTISELAELTACLASLGVYELRITGGEPTVRSDILELIDLAVAAGFYVTLGTNGILSSRMREALSKRALGRFLISLDGLPQVHDALRGAGNFDRTMTAIRFLLDTGKTVRVNTVLCRDNVAGLPAFVARCGREGVQRVSLIVPRPLGRASLPGFGARAPDADDMEAVARLIEPLEGETGVRLDFQYNRYCLPAPGDDPVIQKVLSCPAGTQAGFVSPDGTLYACGCAAEWLADPIRSALVSAGSVRGAGPETVWGMWQRAPVWARFRDLQTSKAPACFACIHFGAGCFGSCPVHALAANGRMNAPDPMCALSARILQDHEYEAAP